MATEVATLTFKANTADLERAEKALDGVTQSGKETASAIERLAKENRELSVSAKDTKKQIEGLNKEARESQSRFNLLEKELKEVKSAHDALKASMITGSQGQKDFTNQTQKATDSTRRMRGVAGQLGFQVQDIAVQLQSGTNAMIVFGQQGSQIAGAFGPGGAILGAVIAVGAAVGTMLVASFSNGTQSAKDLKAEIEGLTENFDALGEAARTVFIRELTKEMDDHIETLDELKLQYIASRNELAKLVRMLSHPLLTNNAESTLLLYNELIKEQTIITQDLAKAVEDSKNKITAAGDKLDLLTGKKKEETTETKRQIEDIKRYVERMQEQAATIGLNTIELAKYKAVQMGANATQMQSILLSAQRIAQYTAEQEAIKKATVEAEKQKKIEEQSAQRKTQDQSRLDEKIKQIIDGEARKAEAEQAATDQRAVQIAESLMSEEEQIRMSYERRSQIILDSTLLTGQQVNEAMAALEIERQDKLREIKDKSAEEDRARSAQTTSQLLAFEDILLQGKSEKQKTAYRLAVNLASAEKRQNAAKIISDSYAAAMSAYKALAGIPIIGPALGAAAAALILGAGVSYAAKSLTGRALGGQVRDGESYVVGERGPEVLTMGGSGRITTNEKIRNSSSNDSGGVKQANITFQISTVDAQGFNDLLDSRRGQIINMINTALYHQGRGAIA